MTQFLASAFATPDGWLEVLKGYGLGVLTLGLFIWHLRAELNAARARESKSEEALLALTRETLASIANLSKVVENLSPAIATLSATHREQIQTATNELKLHIASMCDQLKAIINDRSH
jgi:hypothetical protein